MKFCFTDLFFHLNSPDFSAGFDVWTASVSFSQFLNVFRSFAARPRKDPFYLPYVLSSRALPYFSEAGGPHRIESSSFRHFPFCRDIRKRYSQTCTFSANLTHIHGRLVFLRGRLIMRPSILIYWRFKFHFAIWDSVIFSFCAKYFCRILKVWTRRWRRNWFKRF